MLGNRILTVTFAVLMVFSGLVVTTVGSDTELLLDSSSIDPPKVTGGSSPKTVLVEAFTGSWCTGCPPQIHTLDRIVEEIGYDDLVMIEYHKIVASDPFGAPPFYRIWDYYNMTGYDPVPTTIFDGGGPYFDDRNWARPNSSTKYGPYSEDRTIVDREKATMSPLMMSIEGDLNGASGNIHITLDFTDVPSEDNLRLHVMILENNMYFDINVVESAGHHREYNHICREELPPIAIPDGVGPGDHFEYNLSFTPDPSWTPNTDVRRLAAAAFIQTTNHYEQVMGRAPSEQWNFPVLQACYTEFVEPSILLVNADETDHEVDWGQPRITPDGGIDHLSEELRKVGAPIRMWDTLEPGDNITRNLRTMPTAADMEHYATVIWECGVDMSTLTASDRANIGTYLDNGGNVFLTGSNIAEDANANGWTSWLETNFQATYGSANTSISSINGVFGDPIGSGLQWLNIEGTSPDEIDPVGSGIVSFTYNNTGQNAAIRSTHLSGARTVYFGCNYFLGSDTMDNYTDDEIVLGRLLLWQDQALPPKVVVDYPNGGEILPPGETVQITWNALDVEIPDDGIDIYYCTDYPIATWQIISSGLVNDGIYKWTVPSEASSTCRMRIVARDEVSQSSQDLSDFDFTIGVPVLKHFDIPIEVTGPDWEFISFPLNGISGDVTTVLDDSVFGDGLTTWDTVQWYDAKTQEWKTYSTFKPLFLNNMPNLDNTMGVWVHVTSSGGDDVLSTGIEGYYASGSFNINLYAGWNLVGYPSATSRFASDTFPAQADMVSVYDTGQPYGIRDETVLTGVTMQEGNAYWVRVTEDCTWQVVP